MNTISGMSFYDSLNKLSVGVLILALWANMPDDAIGLIFFVIVAFIVGLFYQMIIKELTAVLRNNNCMIKKAYAKFYGNKSVKENFKPEITDNDYLSEYYRAYYRVAMNGILMNIPVLEALENFLRNLPIIIVLYLISVSCDCHIATVIIDVFGNKCCAVIVLFAIFIATVPAWWRTQLKIYSLVWEGDYYIRIIKNEKDADNN